MSAGAGTRMEPIFFRSAAEFRRWLEKNHATERELLIGFYKKSANRTGLSYKEAVDEALCFGWIDGIVRRIDDERHLQRYTPRKTGSIWSRINVANVERLNAAGRMQPAGLAAFAARRADRTGIYSFEAEQPAMFPAALARAFRARRKAWAFFRAQAPGYRQRVTHWVARGKQAATRERRLARLIAASEAGTQL